VLVLFHVLGQQKVILAARQPALFQRQEPCWNCLLPLLEEHLFLAQLQRQLVEQQVLHHHSKKEAFSMSILGRGQQKPQVRVETLVHRRWREVFSTYQHHDHVLETQDEKERKQKNQTKNNLLLRAAAVEEKQARHHLTKAAFSLQHLVPFLRLPKLEDSRYHDPFQKAEQ
jgi:hypothetical protein